jgi:membrane protein DedA with SNARE-associated domain/rhodanese-related sulfurtransferase
MHQLAPLLAQYGLALIFANVLLEQLGAPLPAVPTLIVAGALSADGSLAAWAVFAAALVAGTLGDAVWFLAGRLQGHRVLRLLCRISLSPDSCVRQAEVSFDRWGGFTLTASKFIPGLSIVGPPLAGALRLGWGAFLIWNTLGIALWAGIAIGAGWILHAQIDAALADLGRIGVWALALLASLLGAYIAFKWWERVSFYRALRVARVSVEELSRLMACDKGTVVVDVRSPASRATDPRFIPGSLALDETDASHLAALPRDHEIVFYCTCPNEATAAAAAKKLMALGYTRVRPLQGGLDAWIDAGHAIEERRGNLSVTTGA